MHSPPATNLPHISRVKLLPASPPPQLSVLPTSSSSRMSLKLSFVVDRTKHSGTLEEINTSITSSITTKLNEL